MKGNKWSRCLKAPIRALSSVRDLYVKGMNNCAGTGAVGYYPALSNKYSHGYSFNSARSNTSDEDLRELIRTASVSKMRAAAAMAAAKTVRRSQSVAFGRIDEDAPCEFNGDVKVGEDVFPRSRSYAVGTKRRVKMFAWEEHEIQCSD